MPVSVQVHQHRDCTRVLRGDIIYAADDTLKDEFKQ